MKRNFLLIAILLLSSPIWSQTAKETTIELSKNPVSAYTVTYAIDADDLEDILDNYFVKENNFKKLKGQGFTQYKGVVWDAVSQDKVDIYYQVKSSKKMATINMMVSKGYDNFVSGSNDAAMSSNIIKFLESLQTHIDKANITLKIEEQKDIVSKEEKKFKDLEKSKIRKEDDIKEANKDLEKIIEKIKEQEREVSKAKEALSQLERN